MPQAIDATMVRTFRSVHEQHMQASLAVEQQHVMGNPNASCEILVMLAGFYL